MLQSAQRRLRTKGRDPARTPGGANLNVEGRFPMKGFCKTHAHDTVGINHCLVLGAVVGTVEHDLGANGRWVGQQNPKQCTPLDQNGNVIASVRQCL